MVDRFDHIVRADGGIAIGQKRVCLIDEARLLVGKQAAFDAIGVVCKQDLRLVVQAAFSAGVFFLQESVYYTHLLAHEHLELLA